MRMRILNKIGRGLLFAAAAPLIAVDEVRGLMAARKEFASVRSLLDHTIGERDEARRVTASAGKAAIENARALDDARATIGKRERALGEERARCVKLSADATRVQEDNARMHGLTRDILAALSSPPGSDVLKAVEAHVAALVEAQAKCEERDRVRERAIVDVARAESKLAVVALALGPTFTGSVVARATSIMGELAEAKRAAVELQAEVDRARAERDEAHVRRDAAAGSCARLSLENQRLRDELSKAKSGAYIGP